MWLTQTQGGRISADPRQSKMEVQSQYLKFCIGHWTGMRKDFHKIWTTNSTTLEIRSISNIVLTCLLLNRFSTFKVLQRAGFDMYHITKVLDG